MRPPEPRTLLIVGAGLSAVIAVGVCVDYSVAKEGGSLVAYRWDGEQTLVAGKFLSVKRDQ